MLSHFPVVRSIVGLAFLRPVAPVQRAWGSWLRTHDHRRLWGQRSDRTGGVPSGARRTDAVLSSLSAAYSRHAINVYSVGTKAIVAAMRASDDCRRLVVVSAAITVPPPKVRGFFMDRVMVPLLRNLIGRTLYEDMARIEEFLASCDDIAWTIMRPGRLINRDDVSKYRVDADFPVGDVTSRADLAAAMLAELGPNGHVHQKVAPTTA